MTRQVQRSRTTPRTTNVWDRLKDDGLDVAERPGHEFPDLPDDLTDISDASLMHLLVMYTRWQEYTGSRLAVAAAEEKSADATLERLRALSAVKNATEKTVTAAKAKAYENPEFVAALERYQAAYAYRKLVETIYKTHEGRTFVVSRELTRRLGRNDTENRAGRYSA